MKRITNNANIFPLFALPLKNRQKSSAGQGQKFGTDQPFFSPEKIEEILDLQSEKKHENSPDFPLREKRDEIKPNREEPEEDNDWEDDEDIIEEPTRELDDPYRPGHGDKEDIPQPEEDDPKTGPKKSSKR